MSEESKQHFLELNNKLIGIKQNMKRVIMEGRHRELENQRLALTLAELSPLPDDTGLYVNLGRSYILESKTSLTPKFEVEIKENEADMEKLAEAKDKLDAQREEIETQLKELLKSDEKLARTVLAAA